MPNIVVPYEEIPIKVRELAKEIGYTRRQLELSWVRKHQNLGNQSLRGLWVGWRGVGVLGRLEEFLFGALLTICFHPLRKPSKRRA